MNKYTDLTLNSMKKANLIKYVRSLEEIIAKYDAALNKEYKEKELALIYIDSPQFGKNKKKTLKQILRGEDKEIKRLKQKLLIGKKANILFFDEVGVDKE